MADPCRVVIGWDFAPFEDAMRRAAEAIVRLCADPAFRHWARHHLPETPERSAMHAAYDRRRRARRRRR